MKLLYTTIIIILFYGISFSQTGKINNIINDVNVDSLLTYVKDLSGEEDVIIDGSVVRINSRNKSSAGNELAFSYIRQKLNSYNLTDSTQSFSSTGKNLFFIQKGSLFPDKFYVVLAHYDDMPSSSSVSAPGADDNASGVAAVIEAARVLSNYNFPYSIIYVFTDEDEYSYAGSLNLAKYFNNGSYDIKGILNLNMIAYDGNNDNHFDVNTYKTNFNDSLFVVLSYSNKYYGCNLLPEFISGSMSSAGYQFENKNYKAINITEDKLDFNYSYDTPNDKITLFNIPYFYNITSLSIGLLAFLAEDLHLSIKPSKMQSGEYLNDITLSAEINSSKNINPPSLFYHSSEDTVFQISTGIYNSEKNSYEFTIPKQTVGTILKYYFTANDEENNIYVTCPAGGKENKSPDSLLTLIIAKKDILFEDKADNLQNWISSSGWDTTSTKYFSAPASFNESPKGLYSNNSNCILTLKNTVYLNDPLAAYLTFKAQWDIESGNDYLQVQLSSDNGSTWLAVPGLYTKPGKGISQPLGEPVYDSTQTEWIDESIDLSSYFNKNLLIRFYFKSDSYISKDGFFVDDISIIQYEKKSSSIDGKNNPLVENYYIANYPNPFNPSTLIRYKIKEKGAVKISVISLLGENIKVLVNEVKEKGEHEVLFDGTALASGIYFCVINSGNFNKTIKMVLIK